MGLMGTLAKVAIGYAAARGVDKMRQGGGGGQVFGLGGGAQIPSDNPAVKAQAQVTKGMTAEAAGGSNPLSDMMEQMQKGGLGALMGGAGGANPLSGIMDQIQKGGLDLGSLMGKTPDDGGRGGLLSQLGGGGSGLAGLMAAAAGMAATAQGESSGAMMDAFNTAETNPEGERTAGLMLRAMIQAAKSDGELDQAEKAKILETLGDDADAQDLAFVQAQLAAPLDPEGLAADTDPAARSQVYAASLMTIRVDTQAEAHYLDRLAKAMDLDEAMVNALHIQMGTQPLYA